MSGSNVTASELNTIDKNAIIRQGLDDNKKFKSGNKLATLRTKNPEQEKLKELKNSLFHLGPKAIQIIESLMGSKTETIQLKASQLVLQHLIPVQIFQQSWKMILKGDTKDAASVIPQLKEFMEYKKEQDLAKYNKPAIDVEVQEGNNGTSES